MKDAGEFAKWVLKVVAPIGLFALCVYAANWAIASDNHAGLLQACMAQASHAAPCPLAPVNQTQVGAYNGGSFGFGFLALVSGICGVISLVMLAVDVYDL